MRAELDTPIFRCCNRPFATFDEMDPAILERLNALVKVNDILYFLGDFCMGKPGTGCRIPTADPMHEDLRGARKSRQAGAQTEGGFSLARQSGRTFDSRSTSRAVPLCLTRLESKQSRIVAPLRAFSPTPA
jgi:hypothetical protein